MNKMTKWLSATLFITSSAALQASDALTPSWYVHADIAQLKQSSVKIDTIAEDDKQNLDTLIGKLFNGNLATQVQQVTFFGENIEKNKGNALLKGQFDTSDILAFTKSIQTKPNYQKQNFQGTEIYQWSVVINGSDFVNKNTVKIDRASSANEHGEENLGTVYFAQLDNNQLLFSKNESSIKGLVSGKSRLFDITQTEPFKVVVNIKEALLHAGLNKNEAIENIEFDSAILQRMEQVSFKLSEQSDQVMLQAGLKTDNTIAAERIESLINGLLIIQMMASNVKPEVKELMGNLTTHVDGLNLIIKTQLSVNTLNKMLAH